MKMPSSQGRFAIQELVKEFGVTSRALRFYEERGLLNPTRRGQERCYSHRDRGRLKLILIGKGIGFSLDDIRSLLDLYDLGDGRKTQLTVAVKKFEEKLVELDQRRRDLDRAYVELNHLLNEARAQLVKLSAEAS